MLQVKINGMSCQHCVSSITKELEANNAKNVIVDLENGTVSWEGELTKEKMFELVEDLGFDPVENAFDIKSL